MAKLRNSCNSIIEHTRKNTRICSDGAIAYAYSTIGRQRVNEQIPLLILGAIARSDGPGRTIIAK